MTEDIVFTTQNHLGIATLSRPQALNALTLPMIHALQKQLSAWESDDTIHAVLLQAAPGKAFCAGGDVRWLYEAGKKKDPEQMQFFLHEYRLNDFIHSFSKPYIVLMDGITMGGGVGISLHGAYTVATEHFSFAMPETGIGLFPDIGASYLFLRCPGSLGIYLGLTGQRLSAEDAVFAGLVKYQIESSFCASLPERLAVLDLSSDAHAQVQAFLQSLTIQKAASLAREMDKINKYFSAKSLKAIMNKLAQTDDDWANSVLLNLEQKSPMSLAVTFEQFHRAKGMTLSECLEMDYCLMGHFMQGCDFYEGVRAVLVDKDKMPKWQLSSIDAVSEEMLTTYFEQAFLDS